MIEKIRSNESIMPEKEVEMIQKRLSGYEHVILAQPLTNEVKSILEEKKKKHQILTQVNSHNSRHPSLGNAP